MKPSHEILIRPLFTEKMSRLEETERKYAFQIDPDANKMDVKRAVEEQFDVKVSKVATLNRKGKQKQMSVRSGGRVIRTSGRRSNWKRAVVTLAEGFTIDLVRGEVTE
ncbi:MAG: 50S ribosomal protein L23 [Candidatus Marinimicrobia bacterium]|jgi:large subunit ribosomal protein L23|nr:50S ribosomal protein L23 [Candidatus Neomarinimicrobiota bacterium]MDP6790227.1 50S ribosomal protein L23 [Candidatus Neomarinimicrobiota bacterium]MDP7072342.1 50S ribosomal protein L23 [Candidatus Neomarinimicrobiota bacterium]|tara:strand:- start:361 stop:684 length:324 start_codon:yes stop_codon:yes gene_type:complete